MLFTHMADPDREDPYDDDTYSHPQGEIPGVSALAGLDPADDARRELQSLQDRMAAIWHELDGMFARLQDLRGEMP